MVSRYLLNSTTLQNLKIIDLTKQEMTENSSLSYTASPPPETATNRKSVKNGIDYINDLPPIVPPKCCVLLSISQNKARFLIRELSGAGEKIYGRLISIPVDFS